MVGLHVAAFSLVTIWVVSKNYLYAPIAAIILAVMLLAGLGISGVIGRTVLPRAGLMAALIVPLISAVVLGGLCLATISGTQIQVPPRPGVMELTIDPPLSFEGSGAAECFIQQGGFTVYAPDLGTLDGRLVSANLNTAGDPGAQASAADSYRAVYLHINVRPRAGTGEELAYIRPGDAPMQLDALSDGLTGTLRFEGLVRQSIEAPPNSPGDPGPPISGTVSWECE